MKEYCPLVFRNLRERFGIDDASFLRSLTKCPKPMESSGKSGARFYNSHDKLYVIKTLTSEEVEQMHSLLKQYHPYVVERHGKLILRTFKKVRNLIHSFLTLFSLQSSGKTLLPQYLAMYRLTVDNVETYMVVIRNAFSSHIKIHKKYDLKGSTVDREASQKEREKDEPTYKDNDFLHDKCKIHIGEDAKAKLMDTLGKSRVFS